uniref:Uncharacterized protein n=1 Tax=Siphoviridae sp. ctKgQ2 TaxID=2827842 RepID=A0A8S5TM85_9CAUD|nr:MAG TPA: hypothetical protein [Siphoviridae sp. ctKgQ2]
MISAMSVILKLLSFIFVNKFNNFFLNSIDKA